MRVSSYMSEAAIHDQSTERSERAMLVESTRQRKRVSYNEGARQPERAEVPERTKRMKRGPEQRAAMMSRIRCSSLGAARAPADAALPASAWP